MSPALVAGGVRCTTLMTSAQAATVLHLVHAPRASRIPATPSAVTTARPHQAWSQRSASDQAAGVPWKARTTSGGKKPSGENISAASRPRRTPSASTTRPRPMRKAARLRASSVKLRRATAAPPPGAENTVIARAAAFTGSFLERTTG
jgi:hypothetical protein